MGRIRVGTSGYQYRHWRRLLYPEALPAREWLQRYASVFDTCELNATFYRLPTERAVDGWRDRTPPGFLFACKGSRYLTHLKRLTDTGEGLRRYFALARRLGRKLGPVLWQLPPRMRPDPERLDAFLRALPPDARHAFEFRDASWYTDETCAVLDAHGAAFCEHDLVPRPPPRITGGFRYLRFHGATGRYEGRYGRRALRPLARALTAWAPQGDAFVYFNNDARGHAVRDALELLDLLREPALTRARRGRDASTLRE
jgi:uncharacterized protein YecE (DUF72 family)